MTHLPLEYAATSPNGAGSFGTDDLPLVALVEPISLFGECLVAALQSVDEATKFRRYQSVADWRAGDCRSASLVLLCQTRVGEAGSFAFDESIGLLKACEPAPAFAIVSHDEEVVQILKYLEKGARGYIPTSLPLQVVVRALRLINAGGVFIPTACLAQLSAQPVQPTIPAMHNKSALSPKELSVASALRKGTPNKIIAYDLGMCESSVKTHVRSIMKKLKANNRTEAACLINNIFEEFGSFGKHCKVLEEV